MMFAQMSSALTDLEKKHSFLYNRCAQKDASSCASMASLIIKDDPILAKAYYKRACDLGKASSCVFSKTESIADLPPVPVQYKAEGTYSNPTHRHDDVKEWYEKTLRYYATNVVVVNLYNPSIVHFTTAGCATSRVATADMDYRDKLYSFANKCDLEGVFRAKPVNTFTLRGDVRYKIKNMYDVVAMTGTTVQTQKIVEGSKNQYFIQNKLRDGIFYDKDNKIVAKFNILQEWYFESYDSDKKLRPLKANGSVTVSEYRGKPVHFSIPLVFESRNFGSALMTQ